MKLNGIVCLSNRLNMLVYIYTMLYCDNVNNISIYMFLFDTMNKLPILRFFVLTLHNILVKHFMIIIFLLQTKIINSSKQNISKTLIQI